MKEFISNLLRRKVTNIEYPIFIIDLETTGKATFPTNIITELSVVKLSEDLSVAIVFDTLIHYPESYRKQWNDSWWSKMSHIRYESAVDAPTLVEVWKQIAEHINNEYLVSYNTRFDIKGYLDPINALTVMAEEERAAFKKEHSINYELPQISIHYKVLRDPMVVATKITKIKMQSKNGKKFFKYPRLEELAAYYDIHVKKEGIDFHRSVYDTLVTAEVLRKMIETNRYRVLSI